MYISLVKLVWSEQVSVCLILRSGFLVVWICKSEDQPLVRLGQAQICADLFLAEHLCCSCGSVPLVLVNK